MNRPPELRSRVITCRGARAAERRLFEEIERARAVRPQDLASPVRVVVPSRSLRRHILRALAAERGAVAGVQVQTLFGFALEVLARAGRPGPRGDAAFELYIRRLAAAQPILNAFLDKLLDGYDSVVGAVRDLLDAGFLPGNEEGVLERLDEVERVLAPERVQRSRSLVLLAAAVFSMGEDSGLGRSTQALQWAEEALLSDGSDLVPTRALLVHGFADVTGIAADLLVAMVRVLGATVVLDRPPDPAAPDQDDLGGLYLSRLEERMTHLDREIDERTDPPPQIVLAEAPDVEAEARWVAENIRSLLDSGADPEPIGVVGRSLDVVSLPLRRHLRRLGIPFSGERAVVPGSGARRKLVRLMELIRLGTACGADLWLETMPAGEGSTELLLGLRVLGVLRLADLAGLSANAVPSSGVRLPVAIGPEEEDEGRDTPRRLPGAALRQAVDRAASLVDALDSRPSEASPTVHQRHTHHILETLGWDADSPESTAVRRAADQICREIPCDIELTAGEWWKLLGDRLQGVGDVAIGGEGGGVQVLTVMESRARTFSHLFMIGCNRGVFPRIVHEDPMLPEPVRARLAADVLPEMPVKARSADEERYLFAQLVSSSPEVNLSWHVYGAGGTMTPSPFIDRLQLRAGSDGPVRVSPLWSGDGGGGRPRTAYELAILDAPSVDATGLQQILATAVEEGREDAGSAESAVAPKALAQARVELLEAVERPHDDDAVSPWFGFTGSRDGEDGQPLWITHAEGSGSCPWREFVEHRLGVLPMPDPLLGLPGIDGPLVGQVVHGVLEDIVGDALTADSGGDGSRLEMIVSLAPAAVPWPDAERYNELVARHSKRVAARAGLGPVGMAPMLAARAREFLEVERRLEWSDGAVQGVLGSEVEGDISVPGLARRIAFRADRVNDDHGTIALVDYKAAKPISVATKESTRRAHLMAKIARGRRLQAAAYARVGGLDPARGEYVFLKPDDRWGPEIRVAAVGGDDEEMGEAFVNAVQTIDAARARGIAFPRVEEPDGKAAEHCTYCAVAEACRRDDSAFRRGLIRWMNGSQSSGDEEKDSARWLWWLGYEQPGGDE